MPRPNPEGIGITTSGTLSEQTGVETGEDAEPEAQD